MEQAAQKVAASAVTTILVEHGVSAVTNGKLTKAPDGTVMLEWDDNPDS